MTDHLVIPDTQIKKGVSLSHIKKCGELIIKRRPDVVVVLGDWWDYPSLGTHSDRGSIEYHNKFFMEDYEAGIKAFELLFKPMDEYNKVRSRNKKKKYKPRLVFTEGNHECLIPETEVLTKRGWVKIPDVTLKDEVYTLSKEGFGRYSKPLSLVSKHYEGNLVKLKTGFMEVECTENHRVLTTHTWSNHVYRLAKDLPDNFKIPVSACRNATGVQKSDDEVRLAGWLCTDSYHSKTGGVVLYQRESNSFKIRDLLNKLEVKYREVRRDRDIKEICGKVLKKRPEAGIEFHLSELDRRRFEVESNKRLPFWVYDLSTYQKEIFIDVIIDADGSVHKSGGSLMFYGKKDICNDVQILCLETGYSASLVEYKEGQYRVNITKHLVRKFEKGLKEVKPYNGMVYCLETLDSNFMIRYKGRCHFTGNCRRNRLESQQPKLLGALPKHEDYLASKGFEVYGYRVPVIVDGVTYCHNCPQPKSAGSVERAHLIMSKRNSSWTVGHSQMLDYYVSLHEPRLQCIIAGAFYTHDESYKAGSNDHWRGLIYKRNVKDGTYDPEFISIDGLMRLWRPHLG